MLFNRHGITLADYDKILEAQNGLCAICTRPQGSEVRRMAVDHNHQTGQVRALLCTACNLLVGWAEHPDLSKALEYVSDWKNR